MHMTTTDNHFDRRDMSEACLTTFNEFFLHAQVCPPILHQAAGHVVRRGLPVPHLPPLARPQEDHRHRRDRDGPAAEPAHDVEGAADRGPRRVHLAEQVPADPARRLPQGAQKVRCRAGVGGGVRRHDGPGVQARQVSGGLPRVRARAAGRGGGQPVPTQAAPLPGVHHMRLAGGR